MTNIVSDFVKAGISFSCAVAGLVHTLPPAVHAQTANAPIVTAESPQARARFYKQINHELSQNPQSIVVIDPAGYDTMRAMLTAADTMFQQRLVGKSSQARANARKLLYEYKASLIADEQLDADTRLAARPLAINQRGGTENDTACLAFGTPANRTNEGRRMGGSLAIVIGNPQQAGKYNQAFLKRLDAAQFNHMRPLLHEVSHCLSKISLGSTVGETKSYHIRLHETGADIASMLLSVQFIGEDKAMEQARILAILRLNKAATPLPDSNHNSSMGLKRALAVGASQNVKGKNLQQIVDMSYDIAKTVMDEIYPHLNDPSLSPAAKLAKTKIVDEALEQEAELVGSWVYGLPHQRVKDTCFLPPTLTPQSAERLLDFKQAVVHINPYPHSRVEACWQKLQEKFPASVGLAEQDNKQAQRPQMKVALRRTPRYQAPALLL